MNTTNLSADMLQNLLKLIAATQNHSQQQGQIQNLQTQNQSQAPKVALNKPITPVASNFRSELTQSSQDNPLNIATSNESRPLSGKPTPRVNMPRPQSQNTGMRNIREDGRNRIQEKMKVENGETFGFAKIEEDGPKTTSYRTTSQPRGGQDNITVLMVAEKPSIAKAITEALCNGRSRSRKGISKFCQVHEFYGDFFGNKASFRVTSVTGHIYVADFPSEYQDWRTVDPLSLFEAPTIKKQTNPESQIIDHLKQEATDTTYLVLWLDNDREGENICFEVIENVKQHMRQESFDQIFRVRFSSLVKQDIVEAFHNISSGPNLNESKSVDARQIIDLKVGVAFSRYQTRYLLRRFPDLNTKLVTFGPCQTPTLGFCVQRADEIKNFVSKNFYRIVPVVTSGSGVRCELTWPNERIYSQEEAQQIKNEIELSREVVVLEATNKDSTKGRPEALNTPQMLKLCSSFLGIGPHQAMQVAEKLYQQGFITYPRTESTSYPQKYEFAEVVNNLQGVQSISAYCTKLLSNINPPKRGKDVGDHPPITPTFKVPVGGILKEEEWKLYEFIARYFLATISPNAKITNMSVTFQAGKHKLHLKGSLVLDRGFMEITPWVKVAGNEIPEFFFQQRLLINSVEIKTGKETPPEYITESALITLMEENGIGTDASMAQHINNICVRNFVKVEGTNRKLIPTELGSALIHSYQKIDMDLVAPNLRSQIEQRVDMIAKGEANDQQVIQEVLHEFSEKFQNFINNIEVMNAIFTESFGTFEDALACANPFSICGRCSNQMLFVEKFNRLYCGNCNHHYTLPQNGNIEIAGDRCCPIDGFQLIAFTAANMITSYLICPSCSNRSPHPEISARLTCNLCPEAECPYSSVNSELQECTVCNQGKMILDLQVADRLTASCNHCTHKILISQNIEKFQRGENTCPKCSSYLFTEISFNNGQEKCENVCVFCHPELSAAITTYETLAENTNKDKEASLPKEPRDQSSQRRFQDRRPQERTNTFENRRPRNFMDSNLQKPSRKIYKTERDGDFRPNNGDFRNNNGNFGKNFRTTENRFGDTGRPQQKFFKKNYQNQNQNNFPQRRNNGPSWKNNQFQQSS